MPNGHTAIYTYVRIKQTYLFYATLVLGSPTTES